MKIDGEPIHVFQSVLFLFESSTAITLELDMIVSEVAVKKYKDEKTLIVEIELEDGRVIGSIMDLAILSGELPQMNLYMEVEDTEDYHDLLRVNENDSSFPIIGEALTIEEIRKLEMPNEKINLKLTLPIDQVEWLKKQKGKELNAFFENLIYKHWGM
ncbi:hypothetical protein ACQYAD_11430 [Neobacillus sp. SM06]|uniref:hypothetical protein n=1 Tax=Neobacillus sp. SM06 TaxID=3422492 RepID=UPI003D2C9561